MQKPSRDVAMNCSILWCAESVSGFNLLHILKHRGKKQNLPSRANTQTWSVAAPLFEMCTWCGNEQLGGEYGSKAHV